MHFSFFFVQKSFLTNFFFTFSWDKLDYPGSIVYLSCLTLPLVMKSLPQPSFKRGTPFCLILLLLTLLFQPTFCSSPSSPFKKEGAQTMQMLCNVNLFGEMFVRVFAVYLGINNNGNRWQSKFEFAYFHWLITLENTLSDSNRGSI